MFVEKTLPFVIDVAAISIHREWADSIPAIDISAKSAQRNLFYVLPDSVLAGQF